MDDYSDDDQPVIKLFLFLFIFILYFFSKNLHRANILFLDEFNISLSSTKKLRI